MGVCRRFSSPRLPTLETSADSRIQTNLDIGPAHPGADDNRSGTEGNPRQGDRPWTSGARPFPPGVLTWAPERHTGRRWALEEFFERRNGCTKGGSTESRGVIVCAPFDDCRTCPSSVPWKAPRRTDHPRGTAQVEPESPQGPHSRDRLAVVVVLCGLKSTRTAPIDASSYGAGSAPTTP